MSGTFTSIRGRRSSRPISAACAPSSGLLKANRLLSRPSAAPVTGCEMPRSWLELLQTTSARLALLYAGLFGLSVSVLFGLIYWAATAALSDRIDQDLLIQRDALIADAGTAETPTVAAV